jgi:hypothetical protein
MKPAIATTPWAVTGCGAGTGQNVVSLKLPEAILRRFWHSSDDSIALFTISIRRHPPAWPEPRQHHPQAERRWTLLIWQSPSPDKARSEQWDLGRAFSVTDTDVTLYSIPFLLSFLYFPYTLIFCILKCKSVTEVLNMYITLWNTELYVLLHIRYTSVTHFFFAAMCNRQYDGLFAGRPRNTFWKAMENVLEGLENNSKFPPVISSGVEKSQAPLSSRAQSRDLSMR